MRVLALAWLGMTVACGGAGVFACTDASECGVSGTCEANGYCSFPDAACASGSRYGAHAPSGIADVCVEPLGESSSGAMGESTTGTTSTASLTIATLEGDGPTSAAESSSSSSTSTTTSSDTTNAIDDGPVESSSSGGDVEPIQIGPLVVADDLDDGAIYLASNGMMGEWLPSGETTGFGFCGEFPANARYFAWLRFAIPEGLPAGTQVHSATVEMFGHGTYFWDELHALRVWAQQSADAPAPSSVSDHPDDPEGVELGDLSVRWADADDTGLTWQVPGPNASPDLAVLVQQLVDEHGGLEAGAHVQLWIAEDEVDGKGEEVGWYDSINGEETAPRLTLSIR
ncbi:MAG TPA: hypothetical protein VG755_29970 [Nannocystaceae bacterium]|nr:hypothetical protein [Nannocystaceae bacterium]